MMVMNRNRNLRYQTFFSSFTSLLWSRPYSWYWSCEEHWLHSDRMLVKWLFVTLDQEEPGLSTKLHLPLTGMTKTSSDATPGTPSPTSTAKTSNESQSILKSGEWKHGFCLSLRIKSLKCYVKRGKSAPIFVFFFQKLKNCSPTCLSLPWPPKPVWRVSFLRHRGGKLQ